MNKIESTKIACLTPEQEAELPRFRQRMLDIACGGGRIDRTALEAALAEAYAEIGKPAPRLFIFDSPAACMLALKTFKLPKSSQLMGKLGDQFREQLTDQLKDQLRDQLGDQLWDQLEDQLWDHLGDQLWDQLKDQLWDQLRDQIWDQLGDQLWDQLGDQLGGQLGSQLRDQLRDQNIYDDHYLFGSQDLYWIARVRFGATIGVKFDDQSARRLTIVERISTQCEWWWPYENIVVASERPTLVRWDDAGRLHRADGPAVEYADGYALAAWHGQAIPLDWVTGRPPSAADALHWPDMDQRAAACEIVGWHRILDELDARVIEDSGDPVWGRLVEVTLPDSGQERFLDARCGTGRRFALPVPPETQSVDEAQSVLHGGLPASILRASIPRT